ncbi:MAG: FIG003003: hypothetical protein, partial [uncultured Nocardioidaceae bacterium]
DCTRRDVRMELSALGRRPLPSGHAAVPAAAGLHRRVRYRRAQRQLLPLAGAALVRELATAAARRVPDVGEGAARPDPWEAAARARGLGGPDRGRVARARRAQGGAARPARADPRARRRPAGLLPQPAAALDPGRGRAAPSELAPRRRLRHPRAPPGGVLRDERRPAAVHPPGHRPGRVRAAARTQPRPPVRRLLHRRRPAVVGRPVTGVGTRGPRGLRLLQQRRGGPCRAQRPDTSCPSRRM